MPSETTLSNNLHKHLKELEKAGEPIFFFKVHGSAYQRSGIPDWSIVYDGVPIYIELKVEGNEPSAIQRHVMGKLKNAGAFCFTCYTLNECKLVLSCAKERVGMFQK